MNKQLTPETMKDTDKRFSYWMQIEKPKVEKGIKDAGITNKKAIKQIMIFMRRVCTMQNRLEDGISWNVVNDSFTYNDASMAQSELTEYYESDWHKYQEATGAVKGAYLGDYLA